MSQSPSRLPETQSAAFGYGLAIVAVSFALAPALVLQHYGFNVRELPLFLLAVSVTSWYSSVGPSLLAASLSFFCFDYFFTYPLYSFALTPTDLPSAIILLVFSLLITRFSVTRRRIEADLLRTTEELRTEVAERRLREETIRALNVELTEKSFALEATNKELEAFAYTTSHDLRAPLRHVAGFAELLAKNAPTDMNEKCRRYISTIQDAAKRMGNLIDDLLSFSRVGRTEAQMTSVDLNRLIRDVVSELQDQTIGRKIVWILADLPDCFGDRSMLKLMFENLLSNAVKFTKTRAEAHIEIGVVSDDTRIELFVKDDGVGFQMKYVDKLFGVFQRLHSNEDFPGTGIGLATVQRIVHRHGGTIRAAAEVNEGATFFLTLARR